MRSARVARAGSLGLVSWIPHVIITFVACLLEHFRVREWGSGPRLTSRLDLAPVGHDERRPRENAPTANRLTSRRGECRIDKGISAFSTKQIAPLVAIDKNGFMF